MSHFWTGTLPLAFVFSVPGTQEVAQGRPVAGSTGENLSMALLHLQQARPQLFPATDRYAYRITNAYSSALSIALGSGRSEASRAEICSAENVARLAQELQGCHTTILCGQRAQWLAPQLHAHLPQLKLVHAWHTSHRALSGKFNPLEVQQLSTSLERRRMRTTLWAQHLLSQLPLLA